MDRRTANVSNIIEHVPIAKALEQIAVGVAITRPPIGEILYANAYLCALLGLTAGQLCGRDIAQFRMRAPASLRMEIWRSMLAGDTWQGETELRARKGAPRHMLESVFPLDDEVMRFGQVIHFFHDVSALSHAKRLSNLAFQDGLTGLPNRHVFNDRLVAAITAAQRSGATFGVLYIDIDDFKRINDMLGRATCDELLCQVAVRMRRAVRKSDIIARFGGDEFAAVLGGVTSEDSAARTVEKLLSACMGWYESRNRRHGVTLSIGVSLYPRDGETAEALLRSAEGAMYRVKAARRNGYSMKQPRGSRYTVL